jgi:hypothetical protein
MEKVKEYERLEELIKTHDLSILQTELNNLVRKQEGLDEEVLKSKILERKSLPREEEAARKNREEITKIKEKIGEAKKAVELLREKQSEISSLAIKEVKEKYWPAYEEAARELLKKGQEALAAEKRLREITQEANSNGMKFNTWRGPIVYALDNIILLPLRLLIRGFGQRGEIQEDRMTTFIKDCKEAGIKIE